MQKELTEKQMKAADLLVNGGGMTYKAICEAVDIDAKTLWRWRNEPEFAHFQDEYKRLQNIQWQATVEAARKAAYELCQEKNAKMVEFILKNDGLNPTQKVENSFDKEVTITIGE